VKADTFFNLTVQWFSRGAVGWVKGIVVAISTATDALGPIPVGTGKPGIYCHFLHSSAKGFPDVLCIRVKPPGMPPWKLIDIQHSLFDIRYSKKSGGVSTQ
jgi:hypothetical protein